MIGTFAKLKAPLAGGRGLARVEFSKSFAKVDPEVRLSMLEQAMKQMRDAYRVAEADHRIKLAHEDAQNAEAIQLRA